MRGFLISWGAGVWSGRRLGWPVCSPIVNVGLSNVSFGVPVRKLVNQTFLMLLLARGLDAAILDPCDRQLMANVAAAEALLGRDEYCERYLRAFRAGRLEAPGA